MAEEQLVETARRDGIVSRDDKCVNMAQEQPASASLIVKVRSTGSYPTSKVPPQIEYELV